MPREHTHTFPSLPFPSLHTLNMCAAPHHPAPLSHPLLSSPLSSRVLSSVSQKHLEEILDQSRGSLDVAVLTHALQKTTEFEVEMHNRFRIDAIASS